MLAVLAEAEYNGWVGIVYEGHSGGMDATAAVPLAAASRRGAVRAAARR